MYGWKILKWSIRVNSTCCTRKALSVRHIPLNIAIKTFLSPFLTQGYREKAIIFNPRFDYFLVIESMTNRVSDSSKENEE